MEMYRDRIEIANSGGLYGKITIDALGRAHPETRNVVLANILELLKVTENRYSGIPTMRTEMRKAGLPEPVFSAVHGEFKVVLKNGYYYEPTDISEAILAFCSVPRSREELIAFTGKSRTYTMSQLVKPLVENGSLKLTLPEKPRSSKQRFVRA